MKKADVMWWLVVIIITLLFVVIGGVMIKSWAGQMGGLTQKGFVLMKKAALTFTFLVLIIISLVGAGTFTNFYL